MDAVLGCGSVDVLRRVASPFVHLDLYLYVRTPAWTSRYRFTGA